MVHATTRESGGRRRGVYERARPDVGRSILLGLEVLIIADIVQTITIDPDFGERLTSGDRARANLLDFSLEIELDGVVPWRETVEPAPGRPGGIPWTLGDVAGCASPRLLADPLKGSSLLLTAQRMVGRS